MTGRRKLTPILASRLQPPRSAVRLIYRHAITEHLLQGLQRRLISLQAPSGFGKTCLAAAVLGHHKLQDLGYVPVWFTVHALDRSPAVFFNDLAAALQRAGIPTAAPPPATGGLTENLAWLHLLQTLQGCARPVLLVLDGLEHLESSPTLDELVQFINLLPETVRLLLTSRHFIQPLFPGLTVAGQIEHLEARDLCFSLEEVKHLLSGQCSREEVHALHMATQGWPALVTQGWQRLQAPATESAPRSASASPNTGHPAREPSFDFYEDVLLKELSPQLAQLLQGCCILESFSLDLAAWICESEIARPLRQEIERSFPLLTRVGQTPAYQILPAIKSVLLDRLISGPSAPALRLQGRAAAWYAQRGQIQRAVHHASLAQDYDFAARLVHEAGGVRLFLQAGCVVLQKILDDLPADVRQSSLSLRLSQAVVDAKAGRLIEARQALAELEFRSQQEQAPPWQSEELVHIKALFDIYCDDGESLDDGSYLEGLLRQTRPSQAWEISWICNTLAVTYLRIGRLDDAVAAATRSLASYRLQDTPYAQVFLLTHLGLISILQGKLSSASDYLTQAEALAQATQWTDRNLIAIVRVGLMELAYYRGSKEQVLAQHEDILQALRAGESWVDLYQRQLEVSVRVSFGQGGIKAAMRYIEQGEEIAAQRHLPRLRVFVQVLRLKLLVGAGLSEAAAAAGRELTLRIDEPDRDPAPPWTWREQISRLMAVARLHQLQQQDTEALALLGRAQAVAQAVGAQIFCIEIHLLLALSHWHLGQEDAALAAFQEAVAQASPHSIRQPFFDEGEALVRMVQGLVRKVGLRTFSPPVAQVIVQILKPAPTGSAAQGLSPSLLNLREREVLELLCQGHSNKVIARKLGITESTVKYHLQHIYPKLGANTRTLAAAIAREHGIVQS